MTDMRSRASRVAAEEERKRIAAFRAAPGGAKDMKSLGNFVTQRDGERYDGMAEGTVMTTITYSNLKQTHVDLRWDLHTRISDVKARLTKHCGTPSGDMRLILRDDGRDIICMEDDDRPIGFYSVQNGNEIHCIDTNPYSLSAGGGLENTDLVKKYEMSDEEYSKRKNTLRAYKREQLKKDPNFKFDFSQAGANGGGAAKGDSETKSDMDAMFGEDSCVHVKVGMRCEVDPGARRGEVMFVGDTKGLLPVGHWVGIKFDEPVGKSNGVVKGVELFSCAMKYGGFIRGFNVRVGDYPEKDLFDSDEEDDSDEEL